MGQEKEENGLSYDGLLVLTWGGPGTEKEIEPYLDRILAGIPIPPAKRAAFLAHYQTPGWETLRRETDAFQRRLWTEQVARAASDPRFSPERLTVRLAALYSEPDMAEAVRAFYQAGRSRIRLVTTAPFGSPRTCLRYFDALTQIANEEARRLSLASDSPQRLRFYPVGPYGNHPDFLHAEADALLAALAVSELEDHLGRAKMTPFAPSTHDRPLVLFSFHSLPVADARSSDFLAHANAACRQIAESVGLLSGGLPPNAAENHPLSQRIANESADWAIVFQSRSGPPAEPWLGPDIVDFVRRWQEFRNLRRLVVLPIGFFFENREILDDLDKKVADVCHEFEIGYRRGKTIGNRPESARLFLSFLHSKADSSPLSAISVAPERENPVCRRCEAKNCDLLP